MVTGQLPLYPLAMAGAAEHGHGGSGGKCN